MLKVNELFSGIGAQSAALKRLGIDFEVVATADTDKDALVSYAALHCKVPTEYEYPAATYMADYLAERNIGYDFEKNKPYDWHRLISKKTGKASERLKKYYLSCIISKNRGDVRKIEKLEYADFWTYSFPCQDTSIAGKQAGIEKHTRSGLLYEVGRLLNVSAEHGELPKYLMLENVKNLVGKKFKQQFEDWLEFLEQLGYNNYWQVLNAKNYGIPQNRERVFGISIRKDVDTGDFSFPKGFDNGLRLKDFLEDEVDEKFYISQEKTDKLISQIKDKDISNAIRAGGHGSVDRHQWDMVCVGNVNPSGKGMNDNVHAGDICPTLTTNKGEGPKMCMPCLTPDREEKRQNGRRFKEDGEPMFTLTGQDRHGVLTESIRLGGIFDGEKKHQAGAVWDKEGLCPTLDTMQGGYRQPSVIVKEATKQGYAIAEEGDSINIQFPNSDTYQTGYRIRKLTPKECWRLMGFTDEEFQKAVDAGVSNSQLYKQAGNSIVVDVLEYIFGNLLK